MRKRVLLLAVLATFGLAVSAQTKGVRSVYTNADKLDVEVLQGEQPTQLHRFLFAGYNTLCLPLTLTASQLQDNLAGAHVERFVAMQQEGNALCLYFLDVTAEGIEAGVPYLIHSPRTQYLRVRTSDAVAVSGSLRDVVLSDASGNRVTFGSSWTTLAGGAERYGIPALQDAEELQSVLVRTKADQLFLPTRCGFTWDQQAGGATELVVRHVASAVELPTGVRALQGDVLVDVYDASGVLVRRQVSAQTATQSLPRGVYVVGGEKVVVR